LEVIRTIAPETTKRGPGRPRKDNSDRKVVWSRLNVDLHRRLKAQAAMEGRTLHDVMDDAMALYLETHGGR
jgi:hypothetical protein